MSAVGSSASHVDSEASWNCTGLRGATPVGLLARVTGSTSESAGDLNFPREWLRVIRCGGEGERTSVLALEPDDGGESFLRVRERERRGIDAVRDGVRTGCVGVCGAAVECNRGRSPGAAAGEVVADVSLLSGTARGERRTVTAVDAMAQPN